MFKTACRRWLLTAFLAALSLTAAFAVNAAPTSESDPASPKPNLSPANAAPATASSASPDTPNAGAAYTAATKVTGPTTAFHDSVASHYNYAFGKDAPFLPSNATTANGQFVSPKTFYSAEYCGHCHREAYHQWRESIHSNSFRAPWYLKNVNALIDEKGVQFSRHCEGCHNPVALLSGDLSQGMPKKRPFEQEGVTCSACHSIVSTDATGTGSYVMGTPAVLVDEAGAAITRPVSDAEILAHLDRHSKAVMRPLYQTAEFCAACHKAAIPASLDNYKWLRAISLYDEWQAASFTKQSPLPFYRKDSVSTCQTCHMVREPLATGAIDPGAKPDPVTKEAKLVSHRWPAGNTLVPAFYNFPDQAKKVADFLKNSYDGKGVFNVDIFALEKEDSTTTAPDMTAQTGEKPDSEARLHQATISQAAEKPHIDQALYQGTTSVVPPMPQNNDRALAPAGYSLIAPLGLTPFSLAPGETLVADVVIQNKGIGHSFVPEQRDFYEAWVDFTVKDGAGKNLAESGFIQPDGSLDPGAHSFTNRLINDKGELNSLHEIWHNRVLAYNNTIQSGRSQLVRYRFRLPKDIAGQISLTATVRYRRFNQHFIDYGITQTGKNEPKPYPEPIIDMASETKAIKIGDNAPVPPGPSENKEWMRWNNYGIGLLDAQQYAASVHAFERVAALRPDYADAFTNLGLVEISWEKYDDAKGNLAKALTLLPGDPRALYYRALVERNAGQIAGAIADLEAMLAKYPRSRDGLRELGFSYYQQHDYAAARSAYERLQAVDPDDLAAHYQLAILYRRLGDKAKAAIESAKFADQKDDPTASEYALIFLRKHPEVAGESVVWHTHDLTGDPVKRPEKIQYTYIPGAGE